MYRNERFAQDGQLIDRVEIKRVGPEIRFKRWLGSDLVNPIEDRIASSEEVALVQEREDNDRINKARRAGRRALLNLLSNPIGNDLVTLLVSLDVLPLKVAIRAGWSPPTNP